VLCGAIASAKTAPAERGLFHASSLVPGVPRSDLHGAELRATARSPLQRDAEPGYSAASVISMPSGLTASRRLRA
jgi:hypothetical protein